MVGKIAIYNIGFERGINEWRDYLKPDGYSCSFGRFMVLQKERPAEIHDFWMQEYPRDMIQFLLKSHKCRRLAYLPVASFVLPEKCWTGTVLSAFD